MKRSLSLILFLALCCACCLKAGPRSSLVTGRSPAKRHINPMIVNADPYLDASLVVPVANEEAVCGIVLDPDDETVYRTETFASESELLAADAYLTHHGACGACSSVQDLVVYLSDDLTSPARRCGFLSWYEPLSLYCFRKMGFSESCAKIWHYNARNTGRRCFWTCMLSFLSREPNNISDNDLNDCLACDEKFSGPIFQWKAGRTRRKSGLDREIKRKDGEIRAVGHEYLPLFRSFSNDDSRDQKFPATSE